MEKKLEEAGANSSSLIRIARDLMKHKLQRLRSIPTNSQDVEINTEAVRYYPHGNKLAHILGYTRELTPEQLKIGNRRLPFGRCNWSDGGRKSL